ncbi:hypothetical protein AN476_07650 [Phaeobacter sp. 11ANDIMAR09]|nr:hypothetical protein AN476_07650 [Phaeobacter sp. 11ANDIMAR09]
MILTKRWAQHDIGHSRLAQHSPEPRDQGGNRSFAASPTKGSFAQKADFAKFEGQPKADLGTILAFKMHAGNAEQRL